MRLKSKQYAKLAVTSLIAAFSFGLAISCVSNHKQYINKVFAEESDGTWTLTDGSLKFQYTEWQSNGYVTQTNQIMVHGNGDGTFDISYQLLGDPPGATTASTETLAEKTIQLTGGYWTPSETGGYGTVSGFPVDVNGLDSGTMITLNINVQYSGNMNEQGSGEGDDENAGTWTWNENTEKLSFQFNDTAAAGYVSTTSQTMVHGNGNGTFDIGYDLYGTPANATMASNDLLASKTIRLYDGYFNENTATVTGNSSEVAGLESYGQITVKVDVTPSGDLNADGWRVNDGDLYFYVLDEVNPASIDSITWNNSSGNGTGEAILSVTISTNGGSFQQVYQINNPTFNPELEGTSGTTLGNTTVEGISEWSDRFVTIDISNKSYSLGESTQEIRYTITYYPNGADGEPSTFKRETSLVEGDSGYVSYEFEQQPENYTRSGYSFVGWSIDSNAEEAEYLPNVSYSVNQDLEVFAVWVKVSQEYPFEVLFAANDGTEKTQTVNFTCPDESTVFEFPSIDEIGFERENYRFLGWSTESDGEVISDSPTIPSGLTTFYAIWELEEQVITYTISYYPNGGQGEPFTRSTDPVEGDVVDVTYTFEGQPEDFINGNLRFEGWSTDESALEAEYTPYESYTINENKVVYAVWVDDSQISDEYSYEILFVANDGTDNTQRITFTAPSETTSYELPSITNIGFERVNYTFVGWSSESDGEIISGNPEIETGLSTFYAIWEYDDTPVTEEYPYEVVFNANGGSGTMETDSFTKTTNTFEYSLPQTCGFTYPDHEFIGWSLTSDGDIISGATVISSGATSFYAIWSESTREYTFNITFQDGGAPGGSMEDVTITSSTDRYEYTLPQCGYQKEGYEFDGWIYLSSGTSKKYQPGDPCTLDYGITNTFRATWTAGEFVTITFNANGGEGTMEPITVENGSTQKVPGCDFTNEGYDFVEWAVGSPSSPTTFKPGDSVTVDDNYTLYAVWEAAPKQYWVNIDGELILVDEKHPEYLTRIDKVIYSESKSTATVSISIVTEENPDVVIDTKYISLSNAKCEGGIVTGYFNLIVEGEKVISIEGVPITYEVVPSTDEEKAADISQDQIDQINSLLPESQDSRVNDAITDLNQGTAYQIVEVASDAKTSIDKLRQEGGEGYTEEDYQRDLQTVQSATEAAVVVGAAAKDTNIATQVQEMTKSVPEDTGVNLNGVLKDFYEQQMQYLLGEAVAKKDGEQPTRRITRAGAPKVNKVDVTDFLKQEFDQMLDFVDRSVDDIEDTLLQVRKCSHESVKLAVNQSITTITSKSFRDFDKDKADREFVETLEPVMMATMQSQVLAVLEEEYNNSDHRNKDKDQVILDEIEAVKDIEMFRIMVMEVLRQKYESLVGSKSYEDDLEKFTEEIYWPCFEAWALDKESPVGFTFEELTKATIESSSKRANSYVIATSADKPEIVFISVFAGVTAVAIAGAIAVPTVLKKKRRGLAE